MPTDTGFYLQHCARACEHGVERSHILPFAVDGALLLEIYVHDGIGTMVIDEKLEELREATIDDVGSIIQLIEPFENDGTLVKRDRTEIEQRHRQLHRDRARRCDLWLRRPAPLPHGAAEMTAEMAAVHRLAQRPRARAMVKSCSNASSNAPAPKGLETLFVLTTRTMHWFIKRGFEPVSPDWLPQARKAKYNWSPEARCW